MNNSIQSKALHEKARMLRKCSKLEKLKRNFSENKLKKMLYIWWQFEKIWWKCAWWKRRCWTTDRFLHPELDKLLKTMPEGSRQVVEQVSVFVQMPKEIHTKISIHRYSYIFNISISNILVRILTGSKTFLASLSTRRVRASTGIRLRNCHKNRWAKIFCFFLALFSIVDSIDSIMVKCWKENIWIQYCNIYCLN